MDIEFHWNYEVELESGRALGLTYWLQDADSLPDSPGVYIFGKLHGDSFSARYVGKAENIRMRVFQHFRSNVLLMNKLKNFGNGRRVVFTGELLRGKYQKINICIKQAEKALMEHFLMEGHDLVNKSGVSIARKDTVFHSHRSWNVIPKKLFVR